MRSRPACRGLTITELLTVVSVITILTTMMSPILSRTLQESLRGKCTTNIGQINVALGLVRNQNNGRFPNCFDLRTNSQEVDPESWWFRKVARMLYPYNYINGTYYDQLTVPRPYDRNSWRSGNYKNLSPFSPDGCALRCPASTDLYDQRSKPPAWPAAQSIDMDRVYDDNYGYNNYGFKYAPGRGDQFRIYSPPPPPYFVMEYHSGGPTAAGYFINTTTAWSDSEWTHIGELADFPEPEKTIVLMDYIKADVGPSVDQWTTGGIYYDGYRFRHGGKANVLFADGHIAAYREVHFRRAYTARPPKIRWGVRRRQ